MSGSGGEIVSAGPVIDGRGEHSYQYYRQLS